MKSESVVNPIGSDEVSTIVCQVWQDLFQLDSNSVSLNDKFKDLGGDSIMSMKLYSSLFELGLEFDVKRFLSANTINDLVAIYCEDNIVEVSHLSAEADQDPSLFKVDEDALTGTMVSAQCGDTLNQTRETGSDVIAGQTLGRLLPSQSWFMSETFEEPQRFSITLLYNFIGVKACPAALKEATLNVILRHEALRTKFSAKGFDESGSRKSNIMDGPTSDQWYSIYDYSDLAVADVEGKYAEQTLVDNRNMDLEAGITFKLAVYQMPEGIPDRVHIIVHHMVADMYSINILREELWSNYSELCSGSKTTGSHHLSVAPIKLAERMAEFSVSDDFLKDRGFWSQKLDREFRPIPRKTKVTTTNNRFRDGSQITFDLSVQQTHQLLRIVDLHDDISVGALLTVAVHNALSTWMKTDTTRILLVNSGRPDLMGRFGVDLSATLGWVSWSPPIVLTGHCDSFADKEFNDLLYQLKECEKRGYAFEISQVMGMMPSEVMRIPNDEKVVVNFIGKSASSLKCEDRACVKLQSNLGLTAPSYSPENDRAFIFYVEADLTDRLNVRLNYNSNLHDEETVKKIVGLLRAQLSDVSSKSSSLCMEV